MSSSQKSLSAILLESRGCSKGNYSVEYFSCLMFAKGIGLVLFMVKDRRRQYKCNCRQVTALTL